MKNNSTDQPMVWCPIAGSGAGRCVDSCPISATHMRNVIYEGYVIGIYAPRCHNADCTFYREVRGDAKEEGKSKQNNINIDF